MRQQVFGGDRQHAARACRRVVHGADHGVARGQYVIVLDEDQVDHQPDHFTRGEVLAGGFIGEFGELADQFLEHMPHLRVVHAIRVQVDVGEFLGDQVQQSVLGQPLHLGVEIEALEDVPRLRGEPVEVGVEVLLHVILIAQHGAQIHRTDVVEPNLRDAQQERCGVDARRLLLADFGQDLLLGRCQHAVHAAKHGERQDHLAVVGLLEVAAQQVCDGPDEGGKGGLIHGLAWRPMRGSTRYMIVRINAWPATPLPPLSSPH